MSGPNRLGGGRRRLRFAVRGRSRMCCMTTSRCLYVLRHAKSSWDDAGQRDHERPLAPRGKRAVKLLAEYVERNGIRPELVLIEGLDAASAAFQVGYESASQFNREYKRFFGQPPMRDIKAHRFTESATIRE